MKARTINKKISWAYFDPNGYIQVRSISDTKKQCREMICMWETFTWKDYEKNGYFIKKVIVDIQINDD